jgi:hypothetical protein
VSLSGDGYKKISTSSGLSHLSVLPVNSHPTNGEVVLMDWKTLLVASKCEKIFGEIAHGVLLMK